MSDVITRLNEALSGRYAVESKLGEGGMATVYAADDLKHERKVALKVLRPELAAVMGAERFLSEIKTTANLQHPHILPLFDSGQAGGFLFYVMPLVEGESLRERLDRDVQLGVDEAVRIARSVAGALQAAHETGVIHRDIKPENILLSRGEPLVSDFGIALAVSHAGEGRLTETGLSLGTPYYMSPEQASADRDPGPASDVYSLGCVLYEMLVGDPPHTGSSAQAVLAKILTEEPRAVTQIRKTVPVHVADAIARALERLPADRFESADHFGRALGDAGFRHTLPGVPTTTAAVGTPETDASAPPQRRHPAGVVLPWALAALATVVAVTGWMRAGGTAGAGPMELWMAPGVDTLSPRAFLAVSPDGRTFALASRDPDDPPLFVRTADNPEWRALPGTEGGRLPTFSPGGERIAYVTADDEVKTVSIAGGSPLTLYDSDSQIYEPHWGANGDIVVSAEDGLRRIRSGGGVDTMAVEGEIFWPFMLPDGSGILYAQGTFGATSIFLFDLEADSASLLIPQGDRPWYLESGHILFGHTDGGLQVVPFDIGRGEVAGSPVPVLDGVVARGFSIAGNGTLVYRTGISTGFGGGKSRFLLVGLDGSVDTLRIPERDQGGVQVSPDGSRLAFEVYDDQGEGVQIYTYDLARRTGPTQLTFEGQNQDPIWSPDGARIAYRHDRTNIFVKDMDGGAPAAALLEGDETVSPTDWTEAGGLVLERNAGEGWDLLRVPSVDSAVTQELLRTDFRETYARVSPDGAWFTYDSNEVGDQSQVFVRAFPTALGPWNVSRGPGAGAEWSADGRAVFFVSFDPAEAAISRVEVELEPSFVAREAEAVWTGERIRGFDVHPDGEHLVVVEGVPDQSSNEDDEDEPSRIVVILNWFEHLRERLDAVGGR